MDRKKLIKRNFSKFSTKYDTFAQQQKIGAEFLTKELLALKERIVAGPILEIGCGTGLLSKSLVAIFNKRVIEITDLSEAMIKSCVKTIENHKGAKTDLVHFYQLDGENVSQRNHYALIVSSFTIQWFQDLERSILKLVGALKKNGYLLLSFQGEGSFPEWQEQCRRIDIPWTANELPSWLRMEQTLINEKVKAQFWQKKVELKFNSSKDFLNSLKYIGAGTQLKTPSLSTKQLKLLIKSWDGDVLQEVNVSFLIHFASIQKLD